MPEVAIVTDSAAMLAPAVAEERGVEVVPLQIVIDDEVNDEGGAEATPEAVAAALRDRKRRVSTSRLVPAVLADRYAALAAQGYEEIVSIHLSGDVSGTVESAQIAAATAPIPVVPVDTRAVGPCVGFAVEAARRAVRNGAGAEAAAAAARARASATRSYFYVHTLEYLRRGGRIGTGAALLGSALAVKPLLTVEDGRVVLRERVRTSQRAVARLAELAVEAAGETAVDVAVAHLEAEERATSIAERLAEDLSDGLAGRSVGCSELSAVLGAHAGPGMVAVVVAPALEDG